MLEFVNKYIIGATAPVALLLAGIYFLVKLKFFPILKFPRVARALAGNKKSSFRALTLSLAGTLGVGNIAGVAAAVFSGGFGAVFWMWISALVAAVLKYAEILLAMRHRVPSPTGFKGGASYYINAAFGENHPRLGRRLSRLFALLCIANCILMGAVMQTGAVSDAFEGSFSIPPAVCGLLLAGATAALFRGGSGAIKRLNETLVPFMSAVYIILSLAVIIPRRAMLPALLSQMVREAFRPESTAGGVLGFLLSRALRFGVMRGLFSNEAGCGTSPTAHISSSSHPCEQGFMGIVEVLVDTLLLCTLTALSLGLNFDAAEQLCKTPMRAVISAYSSAFPHPFSGAVACAMTLMVLCFGFATVSCLAHYAAECLGFLTCRRGAKIFLAIAYCAAVFVGAVAPSEWAWSLSDLTVGSMTLINLAVLFVCRGEIFEETRIYFEKAKNNCKTDKKFIKSS